MKIKISFFKPFLYATACFAFAVLGKVEIQAQAVTQWKVEERSGTTVDVVTLSPVNCADWRPDRKNSQNKELQRMARAVKKTYPYAKEAGKRFQEYDALIASTKNKLKQQSLMEKAERDLISEYKKELQKLSLYQGRILIKLIDREIGKTPFLVLKQLRGSFVSGFYRTLFAVIGLNINTGYDPVDKDKDLEYVVTLYEKGYL